MELVVDANVLFAVCITKGKTEEILFSDDVHLFAPEFLFEEFEKYRNLIIEKTKRSANEFDILLSILKKQIQLVPNEETNPFLTMAQKISPDPYDADYFALALKLRCPLWTNDKELAKQKTIIVYTTADLIKKLNL